MFFTLFLELFLQADCLSEQEVGEVKKALTNEMIADEADEPGVPPFTPVASETAAVTPPQAKKQRTLTLAAFLGNDKPNTANRNNAHAQTPRRKAAQEIDHYLLTSSLDLISDTGVETNPLAWWRDHCHDFPLFACKTYEEVSLYTGIEFAV